MRILASPSPVLALPTEFLGSQPSLRGVGEGLGRSSPLPLPDLSPLFRSSSPLPWGSRPLPPPAMAPGAFPPPPGLTWGVQVLRGAQVLRRALLRAGLGLSLALLLLWASLFLYGSFYWAYLPAAAVVRPLHLGFR